MAYFLRVIRQSHWFNLEWLPAGELQGDTLRDLQTSNNTLSVYEVRVEDDQERVAVALAANRRYLAVLDYAIFDDSNFNSIGIIAEPREGETPDAVVNQRRYNLMNLTIGRLAYLAQEVSRGTHSRIPEKVVKFRISEGIETGMISREKLQPELLQGLQ